ncbi:MULTISPECIES: hypothetical protein [unclassified Oceanispirochaeta]|uniref:hypothetical protein n=1 Tax=unclassified Oceanispirochaeta TaxID=2635722 RepID=UPI0011C02FC3|nr:MULTISPECIES: hypothetical protein [unclassified Oceanispirochaeta]MBF9017052.1 hypothetical protein [Oceanispirochaeta sp. M2]NPD73501.1 hypothetical protein [Oceanispirochaeta sp. M1]
MNKLYWIILLLLFIGGLTFCEDQEIGWVISPELRFTTLDEQKLTMVGGQIGLVLDQWIFGAAFYYGTSDIVSLVDVSSEDNGNYSFAFPRNLIYGGGVVGRSFFARSFVQPYLGLLAGGGGSMVANRGDGIFIVEPQLGADIIISKVRISGVVSYRFSFFSDWFPTSWVSGWNYGIILKIYSH